MAEVLPLGISFYFKVMVQLKNEEQRLLLVGKKIKPSIINHITTML